KTVEPDEHYILPFGKARLVQEVSPSPGKNQSLLSVITYGMGVYWAKNAARNFPGRVEIVDLRTLAPVDYERVFASVKKCNRCLVVTEEVLNNSFAQALAGNIAATCFEFLDAPVNAIGSESLRAVPLNSILEAAMIPNAEKVASPMESLLNY